MDWNEFQARQAALEAAIRAHVSASPKAIVEAAEMYLAFLGVPINPTATEPDA